MKVSIKNNYYRVKKLLINNPKMRDNDNLLISQIWLQDMIKNKSVRQSAVDLLIDIAKGKLTNTESIRRSRQHIQKEFPELRGTKWLNRQKHSQKIKEELREPDMLKGGTP